MPCPGAAKAQSTSASRALQEEVVVEGDEDEDDRWKEMAAGSTGLSTKKRAPNFDGAEDVIIA